MSLRLKKTKPKPAGCTLQLRFEKTKPKMNQEGNIHVAKA